MGDDAVAALVRRLGGDFVGDPFLGPLDRHQWLDQSMLQNVIDGLERDHLQAAFHVVGYLGQVLLVVARDQNRLDTAA